MSSDASQRPSRWRPVAAWLGGIIAAVVTAVLLAWLVEWGLIPVGGTPSTPPASALGPVTASADSDPVTVAVGEPDQGCDGRSWLVQGAPGSFVEPPGAYDDWTKWAREQAVAAVGETQVRITVQGRTAAQVTITDIRVSVVRRRPVGEVTEVVAPCGGPSAYRYLQAELDKDPPIITSEIDDLGNREPNERADPIKFPYRVSLSDAETFVVEGWAEKCFCLWEIEVHWASEGRLGVTRVDHHGKPFVTVGRAHAPFRCVRVDNNPLKCGRT